MNLNAGDKFKNNSGDVVKILKIIDDYEDIYYSIKYRYNSKIKTNQVSENNLLAMIKKGNFKRVAKRANKDSKWGSNEQTYYRPGPNPTVDIVVLRNGSQGQEVLLIKRKEGGAEGGKWALPGGFHDTQAKRGEPWKAGLESALEAALRELKEETDLDLSQQKEKVRHVGYYDQWGRDPRDNREAWAVTNVYLVDVSNLDDEFTDAVEAIDETEVKAVKWVPISHLKRYVLAFDHRSLIGDALKHDKSEEKEQFDPDLIDNTTEYSMNDLKGAFLQTVKRSSITDDIKTMLQTFQAYMKGSIGLTELQHTVDQAVSTAEKLYGVAKQLITANERKGIVTHEGQNRQSLVKLYNRLIKADKKSGAAITPPLELLKQLNRGSLMRGQIYEIISELMQTLLTVRETLINNDLPKMSEDKDINNIALGL